MIDVLILGNGFDLAHELPTSYKNFLSFCKNAYLAPTQEEDNLYKKCCKTNLWMKHFLTRQSELGDTWIDLENEIYDAIITLLKVIADLRKPNQSKNSLTLNVSTQIRDFDFSKLGRLIESEANPYSTFDKNYYNIDRDALKRGTLFVYADTPTAFIKFLYEQLKGFTYLFNHYLKEEILKNLNSSTPHVLSLEGIRKKTNYTNRLHVLSFNYTDTIERLYKDELKTKFKIDIETVYVHGHVSACSNECNLVLGTHTFDNDKKIGTTEITISPEFNKLRKHNQRHQYGTIEAYQDLLQKVKTHTPTFHIIGHSLDKTDHAILEHILLANNNAVINVYYYNEEAQEKLINNITEIITEKEVMAKVRLIAQDDPVRGIILSTKEKCPNTV